MYDVRRRIFLVDLFLLTCSFAFLICCSSKFNLVSFNMYNCKKLNSLKHSGDREVPNLKSGFRDPDNAH